MKKQKNLANWRRLKFDWNSWSTSPISEVLTFQNLCTELRHKFYKDKESFRSLNKHCSSFFSLSCFSFLFRFKFLLNSLINKKKIKSEKKFLKISDKQRTTATVRQVEWKLNRYFFHHITTIATIIKTFLGLHKNIE